MSPRCPSGLPWLRAGWPALLLCLLLQACASLPPHAESTPTRAIADYTDTPLWKMSSAQLADDGRSGFLLQPYGPNSFATRLALCRLATRSLDVQYYLLANDNTGRTLLRALRDAAARGVRVRVLVDDLYTQGEDELLLALASHPGVEVRLFNPFPGGRTSNLARFVTSGLELGRINRRMHNKLFVADNAAAMAGGRNMADEYVMNAEGSNFIDMDTFVAGPAVRDLSAAFDLYWNSAHVYPIAQLVSSTRSAEALRAQFEHDTAQAHPPEVLERLDAGVHAPGSPVVLSPDMVHMLNLPHELEARQLGPLLLARARVLVDPLSKTEGENEEEDSIKGTVFEATYRWFLSARQQLKMVSPYFVPNEHAVEALAQARREGLDIRLVTNSLAATDEPWVHVGYARYRRELLKIGVDIHELSPSLSAKRRRLGLLGKSAGALHMKNSILDHREVFLGSMNLDQRSTKLNTELGLIIESPEMAQQLEAMVDNASSYHLRLGPDGEQIEWVEEDGDGAETVFHEEPETSAWLRFKLWLLSPFIPERQL